jgi:hypothetical protein
MAFSLRDDALARVTGWKYFVRRVLSSPSEDGKAQVAIFSAYKEVGPGQLAPTMVVAETTGKPASVTFTCSDPDDTGEPCPCVCVPLQVLVDQGYSYDELPPFLVWDETTYCWRGADSCSPPDLPPGAPCLQLTQGDGLVCYCLQVGPWPYDTADFNGIELTDPEGCWAPVGPNCHNAGDCYEFFPPGSRIGSVVLQAGNAGLAAVLAFGARKNGPGIHAANDLRDATHGWPWLWLGVDAPPLPASLVAGQEPDEDALAFLREHFTTPARFARETVLGKAATQNVTLVYILLPGVEAAMALAPR